MNFCSLEEIFINAKINEQKCEKEKEKEEKKMHKKIEGGEEPVI